MPYETEEETYASPLREMGLINAEEKISSRDLRGFFAQKKTIILVNRLRESKGRSVREKSGNFQDHWTYPKTTDFLFRTIDPMNKQEINEWYTDNGWLVYDGRCFDVAGEVTAKSKAVKKRYGKL